MFEHIIFVNQDIWNFENETLHTNNFEIEEWQEKMQTWKEHKNGKSTIRIKTKMKLEVWKFKLVYFQDSEFPAPSTYRLPPLHPTEVVP